MHAYARSVLVHMCFSLPTTLVLVHYSLIMSLKKILIHWVPSESLHVY